MSIECTVQRIWEVVGEDKQRRLIATEVKPGLIIIEGMWNTRSLDDLKELRAVINVILSSTDLGSDHEITVLDADRNGGR